MDASLDRLRDLGFTEVTLWVLDTNERSRRFYEAAGFALDGATKLHEIGGQAVTEFRYRRSLVDER